MSERLWVALAILALTAISFFHFPGHTILQSDTQIYVPILERLHDPSLYERDIMATRPHVSFTLYDEAALLLRKLTGAGFENILSGQQICYRAAGICGLYLLGTGLGLASPLALLAAAVTSLGATVAGPAVLTVEYEPVPRGFAMPFLLLSLGLVAHRRWMYAAAAATVAFGFHPPTALGFWAILAGVLVWQKEYRVLAMLCTAPALMAALLLIQDAGREGPRLFSRVDAELEMLQRLRASYNWITIWIGRWWKHYAIMLAAAGIAIWRIRRDTPPRVHIFFTGLLVAAAVSVPFSILVIEKLKWTFMPQFQPGRYLEFATLFVMLAGSIAAIRAARAARYLEAFAFFVLAVAIPVNADITAVFWPPKFHALALRRLMLVAGLGALLVVAARMASHRFGPVLAAAAMFAPFYLIPSVGEVRNYQPLHHRELDELARWARESTPKDAVFLFPVAGQALPPGVFRVRAQRALYVDWKAGGQVNFHREFAHEWWRRWQSVEKPLPLESYGPLGIDYVIFPKPVGGAPPVYENAKYFVYRVRS